MLRLWHELQEINPDLDRRGSKKSIFPSSTIPLFFGTAALIGWIGSYANRTDEKKKRLQDSNVVSSAFNINNILLKNQLKNEVMSDKSTQ